jgi:hypothetical protein
VRASCLGKREFRDQALAEYGFQTIVLGARL